MSDSITNDSTDDNTHALNAKESPLDQGESTQEDLYEEVQVTYSEDDIVCYLSDDNDKIIGFVLLDEEGCEVEHFYAQGCNPFDENKVRAANNEDGEIDLGITSEGVAHTKDDLIDIYKDGKAIAGELQDTLKEINELLDFRSFINPK